MRTAREPLTSQRDLAWGQLADAVCDLNEEMELGNKPKPYQLNAVWKAVAEYAEANEIWLRGLE